MSTNIDGKVVVLTGGSAGLGEDAARYLAARGGEHNPGDHRVAQFARAALPMAQRQLDHQLVEPRPYQKERLDLQSCQQGPSQKLESMQSVAFQRAKSAVRSESRVL